MIQFPLVLGQLLRDLAEFGRAQEAAETVHAKRMLNLEWPTAEAMFLMVRSARRRNILEIGTSNGFSTLWLAAALPTGDGSRLVTIDRNADKTEQARGHLQQAGLAGKVQFRVGQASEEVRRLEGPFDCVFFDADRISAPEQLALLLPRLTDDAILFADNALSHPVEIAGYLEYVDSCGLFDTTLLPVGKGLHIAVRRPA